LYLYVPGAERARAQILASGTAINAALEAQRLLAENHDVAVDVWSAPSFTELRNDALEAERWNRLHPAQPARRAYVTEQLEGRSGPVVAVTDYMKVVPEQVARFVPQTFIPLGTDGYGRSDTRAALRRHFETDAPSVAVAVLSGLAGDGMLPAHEVGAALEQYGLETELPDPRVR
ncbi:MAG: pyruvate dehydrogenase (acetyl-transferring), homodimeric type, partial [Candidatus Dormibacteria bacterium]